MTNKELWSTLIQPDSDLARNGVVVNTLLPKRKDGLYGVSLIVPIKDNDIDQPIADIFATLVKPEQYVFKVTIYDNGLGTHATTSNAVNPLEAFEQVKRDIKRSLVNSAAQEESLRIEESTSRLLDIAENAAVALSISNSFKFEIEKVEIACHPASWNYAERE